MSLASSNAQLTASSPLASATGTLTPTMPVATLSARLEAYRADMAAFDAERRTWCPGRAADGTSRENLRRHILTNLTNRLAVGADYAARLDQARTDGDAAKIDRLQKLVAWAVEGIEADEAMLREFDHQTIGIWLAADRAASRARREQRQPLAAE